MKYHYINKVVEYEYMGKKWKGDALKTGENPLSQSLGWGDMMKAGTSGWWVSLINCMVVRLSFLGNVFDDLGEL